METHTIFSAHHIIKLNSQCGFVSANALVVATLREEKMVTAVVLTRDVKIALQSPELCHFIK